MATLLWRWVLRLVFSRLLTDKTAHNSLFYLYSGQRFCRLEHPIVNQGRRLQPHESGAAASNYPSQLLARLDVLRLAHCIKNSFHGHG